MRAQKALRRARCHNNPSRPHPHNLQPAAPALPPRAAAGGEHAAGYNQPVDPPWRAAPCVASRAGGWQGVWPRRKEASKCSALLSDESTTRQRTLPLGTRSFRDMLQARNAPPPSPVRSLTPASPRHPPTPLPSLSSLTPHPTHSTGQLWRGARWRGSYETSSAGGSSPSSGGGSSSPGMTSPPSPVSTGSPLDAPDELLVALAGSAFSTVNATLRRTSTPTQPVLRTWTITCARERVGVGGVAARMRQ